MSTLKNIAQTLRPPRRAGGFWGGSLPAVVVRVGVLVVDYLIVTITVFSIVPNIGVFIYDNSSVDTKTNLGGQLTLWLIPFAVAVLFFVLAELAVMRWMWRAGSRFLGRLSERAAAGEAGSRQAPPQKAAKATKKKRGLAVASAGGR